MKKGLALSFAVALATVALGAQGKVLVAAASNLGVIAPALASAFEWNYPGNTVEFTFGASGALAAQLLNGAPFELFLSADTAMPQRLVEARLTEGPVRVYALGSLIFLTTRKLDLAKGLAVLLDPALAQVAISNPETAPYGLAARQALVKAGLYEALRSRLVTGQNVTQTLQFTLSSVDGGFVNKSALAAKEVAPFDVEGRYWFAVDPALYEPIMQGFVVMKGSLARPSVRAFAAFLSSSQARAVFASFGYGPPAAGFP
ncbi:MAG: molybdate ABC transporter substrate-binding protein [Rectinemataceae bacterium]